MNLDTLLDDARPDRPLTLREQAALAQLIDETPRSRRRPRARWIAGIAALSALLLAGGAGAAAAAGVWHPSWYDPDSDWTTEVKTVHRTFTVDGQQHHCTATLQVSSLYNGKGTPEFQMALNYLRSLDTLAIQPDPSTINDFLNPTWVGQGDPPATPSDAWANEMVWTIAVSQKVFTHLEAAGLDSQKVLAGPTNFRCDFSITQ